MYQLDRSHSKTKTKTYEGLTVLHTNSTNCIVQDIGDDQLWMSVPQAGGLDLYPMKAI